MHGFQLWANLPASLKMTDPRYQDIPASAIPEITDDDETRVRGDLWRILGQESVSPIPLPLRIGNIRRRRSALGNQGR
jgi:redox-sensitive bicupin YhaK (pirin superfamily)